jgi:hypothetical protein
MEKKACAIAKYIKGSLKVQDNTAGSSASEAKPNETDSSQVEDEGIGPKTAEMPDPEVYFLSQLEELLDWGPEASEAVQRKFFEIA